VLIKTAQVYNACTSKPSSYAGAAPWTARGQEAQCVHTPFRDALISEALSCCVLASASRITPYFGEAFRPFDVALLRCVVLQGPEDFEAESSVIACNNAPEWDQTFPLSLNAEPSDPILLEIVDCARNSYSLLPRRINAHFRFPIVTLCLSCHPKRSLSRGTLW
jgi:hypothetical protein